MNSHERKELAVSKILIIILAVIGLAVVVWLAWIRPSQKAANVNNFAECAAAGNPVQQSYPEVCVAPTGQRFTNAAQSNNDAQAAVQKVAKTPFTEASPELQALIVSEFQKQAPTCVKDGKLVAHNGQAINPVVTKQGSEYAIVTVGCDIGIPTLFGQERQKEWQVLTVSKNGFFDCNVLAATNATQEFFETATGNGLCMDVPTGKQQKIRDQR